jgi:hypothetical protein
MQNKVIKKSMVFGIILIFVGVCISSSIISKSTLQYVQSPKTSINPNLIDNDYVIAYWKFDEGSGNTLEDSSGHDFDGAITGATWTSGHSGYALDFDGTDDYISLDEYSEDLGYNKTDDVIYSFWFKSNSYGMIYCITRSWGYNPEHYINLSSNGTLMFRVWTVECGITLFSKKTYDDGNWHHAVYYFNGLTTDPTVELYVDNKFDNNKTEWLCNINNDDYEKTKMGRHSKHQRTYFDGALDEFKIIKYPGGNKQTPPTITGPTSGGVGEELSFTFVSNDPEGDNVSYSIDWGDGDKTGWLGPYKSGEEIIKSHSWDTEGEYEIKAKAKDYWEDSHPTTYIVRIGNKAPNKPEKPSGPTAGSYGVEYTFSSRTTDPDGDELYYKWSWGDDNYSGWLGPFDSGVLCETYYSWSHEGVYNITVKAKDQYGESDWSDPLQIQITRSNIEIEEISGGLLKIKAFIKNTGTNIVQNVNWNIDIAGSVFTKDPHWNGVIDSIEPEESVKIESGILIGLGKILITVTAETDDSSSDIQEKNAFIILFFII